MQMDVTMPMIHTCAHPHVGMLGSIRARYSLSMQDAQNMYDQHIRPSGEYTDVGAHTYIEYLPCGTCRTAQAVRPFQHTSPYTRQAFVYTTAGLNGHNVCIPELLGLEGGLFRAH